MDSIAYETLKASNPNGKALTLYCEIDKSWGYFDKKNAIVEIAKELSQMGYEVKYNVTPTHSGTGIYVLYMVDDSGNKKLVSSNNKDDAEKGVVVSFSPADDSKDIIAKVCTLV